MPASVHPDAVRRVFTLVAALLHLGNVDFKVGGFRMDHCMRAVYRK